MGPSARANTCSQHCILVDRVASLEIDSVRTEQHYERATEALQRLQASVERIGEKIESLHAVTATHHERIDLLLSERKEAKVEEQENSKTYREWAVKIALGLATASVGAWAGHSSWLAHFVASIGGH